MMLLKISGLANQHTITRICLVFSGFVVAAKKARRRDVEPT